MSKWLDFSSGNYPAGSTEVSPCIKSNLVAQMSGQQLFRGTYWWCSWFYLGLVWCISCYPRSSISKKGQSWLHPFLCPQH